MEAVAPVSTCQKDRADVVGHHDDQGKHQQPSPKHEHDVSVPSLEEWQIQRDDWKQQGDDAFRRGDYETACRHYTQALSLDPNHAVLLSNRSASYLKANHKSKALQDAQQCVIVMLQVVHTTTTNAAAPPATAIAAPTSNELAPHKAYSRLAAALWSLGRWQAAKDAYEQMIRYDPNNSIAMDGIQQCNKQLQLQLQQQQERNQQQEIATSEKNETSQPQQQQQQELPKQDDDDNNKNNKHNNNNNDEDDLLNGFFDEVEATAKPVLVKTEGEEGIGDPSSISTTSSTTTATIPKSSNWISHHKKDLGTAHDQIQRLLQPNYQWRNLNPYGVLELPHTASDEEISQRYKALSLLLHPDKCRHEVDQRRAQEAYDQVQAAKTMLLTNPDKARHVRQLIEQGMKQGKREYLQQQQLQQNQQQQNQQQQKQHVHHRTLEEYQSIAVQKILAEVEQRRRDVERRKRQYEQRERQQEDDEHAKEKRSYQFDQDWRQDDRVESRVGNWRNFSTTTGTATTATTMMKTASASTGGGSSSSSSKKKKHKTKY